MLSAGGGLMFCGVKRTVLPDQRTKYCFRQSFRSWKGIGSHFQKTPDPPYCLHFAPTAIMSSVSLRPAMPTPWTMHLDAAAGRWEGILHVRLVATRTESGLIEHSLVPAAHPKILL